MNSGSEREVADAVIATTKMVLNLVTPGDRPALTLRHRMMLLDASSCFEQASKLLADIAKTPKNEDSNG